MVSLLLLITRDAEINLAPALSAGSQVEQADVITAPYDRCSAGRWTKCMSLVGPAGKLHDAPSPTTFETHNPQPWMFSLSHLGSVLQGVRCEWHGACSVSWNYVGFGVRLATCDSTSLMLYLLICGMGRGAIFYVIGSP